MKRLLRSAGLVLCGLLPLGPALSAPSTLSELSLLPVAVSVVAVPAVLSGVGAMTVVSVEAASDGTVWVLERASDGARATFQVSQQGAGHALVSVGTAVTVTAFSAGWLLSNAGKALAYVPNEAGKALLHHERVSK